MTRPELTWGTKTWVMGIINVTPDSFSGDGLAADDRDLDAVVAAAVEQGTRFVEEGAELLDVGAESSRPAHSYGEHPPVTAEREAELAVPVVAALAAAVGERALISIDTTKGAVARAALAAGAGMINDVWAGLRDPDTLAAAAEANAFMVVMHNRDKPDYPRGVVAEVVAELAAATERAAGAGVAADRLLVDPGIGFGKTPDQSLEVLHRLADVRQALGFPLLVGTSRKRFIGEVLGGLPPEQRVEGTAASVALAVAAGADMVRVHDVAHLVRTVRVADAIVRRGPTAPRADGAVSLRGIEASGRHGVSDAERANSQPFEVDVTAEASLAGFGAGDDLEMTVDYAELQRLVVADVGGQSLALIESLARRVAATVLGRWPQVAAVDVRVRKVNPPLPTPGRPEARVRVSRETLLA